MQRIVCRMAQHVAHFEEVRFVVHDHTTVRRNADLTVRKSIQGIDRFVWRYTRSQMHQDLYIFRCIIVHFLDLDLPFIVCLQDRFDHGGSRSSVWNFTDNQCFVIQFRDFRTDFHRTATLTVIIFGDIDITSCLKIRIQSKVFVFQISDWSIQQFIEVMRQYFGRKSHSDPFHTLS